jgi:hypothetical protein
MSMMTEDRTSTNNASSSDLEQRVSELEKAQAVQAATQAGAEATQAAAMSGAQAAQAATPERGRPWPPAPSHSSSASSSASPSQGAEP